MSWGRTSEEGFGGSSSAMIVLLVKQVHLQKEVGAMGGLAEVWGDEGCECGRYWLRR